MAESILRQHQVLQRTGLSRTSLWRLEAANQFPRRRKIIGNCVGWREADVDRWIRSRFEDEDLTPAA